MVRLGDEMMGGDDADWEVVEDALDQACQYIFSTRLITETYHLVQPSSL